VEQVTTVGIDLAKRVFALHGVDGAGRVVLRRTVQRDELVELVAGLSPCLIGMEAGSGAHEWARRFQAFGHTVRLMAAKFVTPYRRNGKNDGNDAEAICEAVGRPGMRFVPIKSAEQQAVLAVHRVRQGFVEERTSTINRIRGLTVTHPALGWGFVVGVVAIAGLPPLGIFMSEFLIVSSTFARQPLLAIALVFGLLLAFGALTLRLTSVAFGEPRGSTASAEASYVPMLAHIALVLCAGIYLPAPLVVWFQHVARLLG